MSDNSNHDYNRRHDDDEEKASRREVDELDRRFNKIEDKLSELTEAVVAIARAEEKLSTLMEDTKDLKVAINNHTNRIHELENLQSKNTMNIKTITGISWVVLGGFVTGIITIVINYFLNI